MKKQLCSYTVDGHMVDVMSPLITREHAVDLLTKCPWMIENRKGLIIKWGDEPISVQLESVLTSIKLLTDEQRQEVLKALQK